MISLHRSPCVETFDNTSPVYKTVYEQLAEAKKELPAYIPQLLGVIRQNGASEFLYTPNAYKALNGKKFYCIDYYFSEDGTTFHHTTSIGYNENAPDKEALLACFDPKQEAARVRFVLDCLKQGQENPATFWMPRILQEPVTEVNKPDFKNLIEHLRKTQTHIDLHHELIGRIEPPTAPKIIITTKKENKLTPRDLVGLGKQYETGPNIDPFKAERCYWRALCLDPKYIPAKRHLALLIYSGKTCLDPTLEFSKKMLEEAYLIAKKNYDINRALAEIYYYGSSTIAPNSTKAVIHLKACLKSKPKDEWAARCIEHLKSRINKNEAEIKEETAVRSIALLFAAKAAETQWNREIH